MAPAKAAEVPETMRLAGRVTFNDQRVTHVFSPVTGRVTRIFANVGDTVAKGAPLADVDSPDVGIVMSDLVKAEADAEAACRDLDRASVHLAGDESVSELLQATLRESGLVFVASERTQHYAPASVGR